MQDGQCKLKLMEGFESADDQNLIVLAISELKKESKI